MLELSLLTPSKETPNKLRWSADQDGVPFNIYVPKWRVPEPWPRRIHVKLSDAGCRPDGPARVEPPPVIYELSQEEQINWMRKQQIEVDLQLERHHQDTVRYKLTGLPDTWHVGTCYIPQKLLTSSPPRQIRLTINWLLDGESFDELWPGTGSLPLTWTMPSVSTIEYTSNSHRSGSSNRRLGDLKHFCASTTQSRSLRIQFTWDLSRRTLNGLGMRVVMTQSNQPCTLFWR